MITKERGEEEEDDEGDEGDEVRDGCDEVGGEELCLTEVVLVVRGRRIRVDRYTLFPVSLAISFQPEKVSMLPSTGPG